MLSVENLSFKRKQRYIIDNLSFELLRYQTLIILGPNGSGKTTLLRLLAGLLPSASGRMRLDQHVYSSSDKPRGIAYLSHHLPLYLDCRVIDYLQFCAELYGVSHAAFTERSQMLNSLVPWTQVQNQLLARLSRGLQQRVALVAVLLQQPRLLLLDEPITGLDEQGQAQFVSLLAHLKRSMSVILSTHAQKAHLKLADKLCLFQNHSSTPLILKPNDAKQLGIDL